MLEVTRRELEKAYRQHRNHYGTCSSYPHRLLLVYCVECGLKALLMQFHRVDRYNQLPADLQVGHDIRAALKLLGAPPGLSIRQARTAHGRPPQQPVTPGELHQAFRYGIPIDPQAEVTQDLQAVVMWIEEQM
jgi:hypothetical protein